MEKYSRWRDAGTGIQPFLPPVPPRTESSLLLTLSNAVHYIVGPIQGLVKLALVLVLSLLHFLMSKVLGIIMVGPLHRIWSRIWSTLFLRLILFASGFFYIKTETISLRRGSSRRNTSNNANQTGSVKSGDIIVANWTSYIDVIYLAYAYGPVFTQVYPQGQVRRISFWKALRLCTKMPASMQEETGPVCSVRDLAQQAKANGWGPVVVFPEGTTSNGRALLKFAPVFKTFQPSERDGRFHVLSFRYEYRNLPPTYTVGNQFWHFCKLCSQFYNTLSVKRLASDDVPCNPAMTSSQEAADLASLAGKEIADDLVGGQLTVCLGNMSRLRKTNLSMNDKRDFLEYYHSRDKKSARKQEQQTLRSKKSK
ncbi:hypothetical protein BDB00DRAFT_875101 [Zychaea mexicana]|uniref:uncharacterized protein n=1 Tax=Zychaea mexicana TaxID=64656 RepID=UPI0022FDC173|nr:uncharacterized protein BDB00DRAFT_875101 [Zychaea mexicana]KAI9490637.1 hypothetical protein BDB00DRAFT_875101 [Zychaea mexicana]